MNSINGTPKFTQLDEEGYFVHDGLRVTDEEYGRHLLTSLHYENRALVTDAAGTSVIVEAFSEPLVARHVNKHAGGRWTLTFPYGVESALDLERIYVDEWDRFHGWAEITAPNGQRHQLNFVMSREAQSDFFNFVDEFDDDGFTVDGKKYVIQSLYVPREELRRREFWSQQYRDWRDNGDKPAWDQGEAASPLRDVLPTLKLLKQRIAVVGAGAAHDAAYLAQQGHLVTAIDISPEAGERAKSLYGSVKGLDFLCADALYPPPEICGRFDLVFEHTFFCAVDPMVRGKVVDAYKKLLAPEGHLLGIFFVMSLGGEPPFGATEWEIRERLKKSFNFLYWTRWRKSIPRRQGKELVVYAQRK